MTPLKPENEFDQQVLINKALLSLSADPIIMIDKHGIILDISESAYRLFGHADGTLLGRNVNILMPVPHKDAHNKYIERFLKTGEAKAIGRGRTVEGLHANGHVIPIFVQVAEVWDGGDPFFVGIIRDRTSELQAKAHADDLRATLERTSRQAALGEFATGLAHEVNQPLTAIDQYLSALKIMLSQEDIDRKQASALIDKAVGQCERAGGVIRSLKRFVRGGQIQRDEVDMARLVSETMALSLLESERDTIYARISADEKAVTAFGDKIQLQQVIHNLLRNAVDAVSGQKEAKIEIMVENDGPFAKISVRDNGEGIAPEFASKVFDRFSTSKTNGLGIGLALSKSIVEAHDGDIWLETSDENGSTFCVKLPSTHD